MDKRGPTPAGIRVLTRIGMLTDEQLARSHALREEVYRAREEGCSWRMVGVALGVSAQAAWERYGATKPDPERIISEPLPFATD